jgi:ribonuclease J
VRCLGAPKDGDGWEAPLDEMIADAVDNAIDGLPAKSRRTDAGLEEAAGRAIRRVAGKEWGKRPIVTVMVTRLEE